jgi:hypothetical protein
MKHLTLLLVPALALQVSCSGGSPDAITEKRGAVAASTYLPGFVSSVPGSDVNQCMNDAGNMLQRLNARGELLGFQYTHAGYTGLSGSTWHVQGIVRLPFYSWDSVLLGQWFAAAFSHPGGTGADYGAHFGVAQSAHKGGVSGLPLGTNRAFNENWDGNTADWNVTPYPDDSFIPVNGTPKFKLDDTQNHPGGPSALGWHVAVPLQKWAPNQTPGDSQPLVKMYSLWNPDAPVLTSSFLTHINNAPGADVGTDAMGSAIVKLADGRFLLAVNKSTPTPGVEFYVSADTDIESPTLFGAYRVADAYLNLANSSSWQNMTFVVDCNGSLWLLGFRGGGEDWIDLFSIALYGGGTSPDTAYQVSATYWDAKHMYCSDNSNTDQCDMEAAAGGYVDSQGHLVVYSLNFDNDGGATSWVYGNGTPWNGTSPAYGNYMRGVEFRDRHGNGGYPAGQACPTMNDAWVELYENANFNSNGGDPGQVYHIDYREATARNGKNLGTNYFNDKASSVRYCIPSGNAIVLYRDAWAGSYQYLNGDGNVRYVSSLTAFNYAHGGGGMNDSVTSYRFASVTDSLGWIASVDNGP